LNALIENSVDVERLYGRLSADPVGQAILRHLGIEPLSGYYIDSQGIHKSPSPGGRQVEMTDGSSEWISTDRIAEYNEKNVAFKSQATLSSEASIVWAPAVQEMKAHNLKLKLEATRINAIEDRKTQEVWLRGLELKYVAARKASKVAQVKEIQARSNAQEKV
jgi:hypothetical protein